MRRVRGAPPLLLLFPRVCQSASAEERQPPPPPPTARTARRVRRLSRRRLGVLGPPPPPPPPPPHLPRSSSSLLSHFANTAAAAAAFAAAAPALHVHTRNQAAPSPQPPSPHFALEGLSSSTLRFFRGSSHRRHPTNGARGRRTDRLAQETPRPPVYLLEKACSLLLASDRRE